MQPKISIIIVNYNGLKWLKDCLTGLSNQNYKNYEIIFVDNASKDESVSFIKKNFPKVKIVVNKTNSGFAGGNNEGFKVATGEYILLLNNDTKVAKDYLETFIEAFAQIPNLGMAQSKIRLMATPDNLDTCGSFWTNTTFLYHVGNGKNDLKIYQKPFPVFSTKGASVLIKKEVLEKTKLFDDDFWCYYEETDLCHRIWLAGYECWYWPNSEILHAAGGTSLTFKNDFIQFHNFKNKLLSFLKNFEIHNLIYIIPIYLILNIGLSLMWLLQGKFKHSLSLYKSIYWNITNFENTQKKRKSIQKMRTISDNELFKKIKKDPSWDYYKYLFQDKIINYDDMPNL